MESGNQLPEWVVYVQAFAPILLSLVLGGFGAFIALRQWRTSEERLKIDLFDKRYALVERIRKSLGPVLGSGKPDDSLFIEFSEVVFEGRFLFPEHIVSDLEEYRKRLIDLMTYSDEMQEATSSQEDRVRIVDKRSKAFRAIADYHKFIAENMAPLMRPKP